MLLKSVTSNRMLLQLSCLFSIALLEIVVDEFRIPFGKVEKRQKKHIETNMYIFQNERFSIFNVIKMNNNVWFNIWLFREGNVKMTLFDKGYFMGIQCNDLEHFCGDVCIIMS